MSGMENKAERGMIVLRSVRFVIGLLKSLSCVLKIHHCTITNVQNTREEITSWGIRCTVTRCPANRFVLLSFSLKVHSYQMLL